jgi:hypothetical protein
METSDGIRETTDDYRSRLRDIIGHSGRMISQSKSGYLNDHPSNTVMFNAVIVQDGQDLWCGDLDVTKDHDRLHTLAQAIGPFTVYPESWLIKHTHSGGADAIIIPDPDRCGIEFPQD